jgi:hypothetical protein
MTNFNYGKYAYGKKCGAYDIFLVQLSEKVVYKNIGLGAYEHWKIALDWVTGTEFFALATDTDFLTNSTPRILIHFCSISGHRES